MAHSASTFPNHSTATLPRTFCLLDAISLYSIDVCVVCPDCNKICFLGSVASNYLAVVNMKHQYRLQPWPWLDQLDARLPPTARRWKRWLMADAEDYGQLPLQDFDVLRDVLCTSFSWWLRRKSWHSREGSAATWYVRYCRDVRTHALHDSNFCYWANRGDDFASLHTQQFDKLSEMTYRRSQVFYAMPGWSVSKTRFTVFQEYTKWQTLSKPWICSLLAHKLADTTCKSMKIYCTSGSTSIHTRWSHDWSGTCMFLNCSVKTMHPLTVCHAF